MKCCVTFSFFILILISPGYNPVHAQISEKEYQLFVLESSLPDNIREYYDNVIKQNYSLRTDLNPFYLRGDFDGDKLQDYALSIIDRKSFKKGILIYHSGTKSHFIIGAGKPLINGNGGNDYSWMDAWSVHTEKEVEIGISETEKITLQGEALLVIKTESASALIYWTGKEYRWYHQGD